MNYYQIIYPLLYLITFFIGVINYSKIRNNSNLKPFLVFIAYSFLTEILGFVLGVLLRKNTFAIYNTWILINHFFYLLFFYNLLKNSLNKYVLKFIFMMYSVFTFVVITFYSNFFGNYLMINDLVGSILIVIAILIYFSELLQSDEILNLKKSIYFWISLGVLFFNIGFIPVNIFAEFILFSGVFNVIALFLNVIMISCFITGFIVSKKEYNN